MKIPGFTAEMSLYRANGYKNKHMPTHADSIKHSVIPSVGCFPYGGIFYCGNYQCCQNYMCYNEIGLYSIETRPIMSCYPPNP